MGITGAVVRKHKMKEERQRTRGVAIKVRQAQCETRKTSGLRWVLLAAKIGAVGGGQGLDTSHLVLGIDTASLLFLYCWHLLVLGGT